MKGMRRMQLFFSMAIAIVMTCIGCSPHWFGGWRKETVEGNQPLPEASSFREYVTRADLYRNWAFYPSRQGMYPSTRRGLTPAKNPHGAYLKLYGNKIAIQAAKEAEHEPMPYGAILILENYDKEKTLKSVTFMYKVKGFNPEGGDWFWGTLSPDGEERASGKVEECIECHGVQRSHDWRFTGAMPHH